MKKILVTGSAGQVGSVLVPALQKNFGTENVIAGILKPAPQYSKITTERIDTTDKDSISQAIKKHSITDIYHLAGMISGASEKEPDRSWQVNFDGLKNVLDVARDLNVSKIFWPSSIAAFGPNTPRENTPQTTILEPSTIYGVAKVAGELLCNYYHHRYKLDVRSLRYPGLISHAAPPSDGTTEYSISMFYAALQKQPFSCFLKKDTALPMMYMADAIKATIDLMEAPSEKIKIRTSYNVTAFSFTPGELASILLKHFPDFKISYDPDFHQAIADSWPKTIDDSAARQDWGWQPQYDLPAMVEDMLKNLEKKLS
ncbi:MAG: NAD-dependent epimerase/dehydratase family protein [Patescibacteria group bacterium]|jgi:nucleoside-diphosphate-sugar epimerase